MNTMKRFIVLAGLLLSTLASFAQSQTTTTVPLTANTVANVVAGRYVVDQFYFVNTSTNIATIKLYDAATAITNVVRPAYNSILSYATNYNVVFTNIDGIIHTNTLSGYASITVANSAVTNERVRLIEFVVPASSSLALPAQAIVANGLTALSSQSGSLMVTYRGN